MNLRVDLIMPAEQRSASRVNPAMVGRVASVLVPALAAFLVLVAALRYQSLLSELRQAQLRWKQMEGKHKASLALVQELKDRRSLLGEIQGWRSARIEWASQLLTIQQNVPAAIQLTDLRTDEMIQNASNRTVRISRMKLLGKTKGVDADAEAQVARLRERLLKPPTLAGEIRRADIPPGSFRRDPSPAASKLNMVFEIDCEFVPKEFQ